METRRLGLGASHTLIAGVVGFGIGALAGKAVPAMALALGAGTAILFAGNLAIHYAVYGIAAKVGMREWKAQILAGCAKALFSVAVVVAAFALGYFSVPAAIGMGFAAAMVFGMSGIIYGILQKYVNPNQLARSALPHRFLSLPCWPEGCDSGNVRVPPRASPAEVARDLQIGFLAASRPEGLDAMGQRAVQQNDPDLIFQVAVAQVVQQRQGVRPPAPAPAPAAPAPMREGDVDPEEDADLAGMFLESLRPPHLDDQEVLAMQRDDSEALRRIQQAQRRQEDTGDRPRPPQFEG